MPFLKPDSRIFVASERTLAGRALASHLSRAGHFNVQTDGSSGTDLQSAESTRAFLDQFEPEFIFFTGALSAGIGANQKIPEILLIENSKAALNLFENAARLEVRKILYLASSCVYPQNAPQPMKPEHLMTGPLERVSEAYAVSKILGMTLAEACRKQGLNVITAIPADIYGPEDDFDPENSHVTAALFRKMHTARENASPSVTLWGTGRPVRDLLYSGDLAEACMFLIEHYEGPSPVNISSGNPLSIKELAAQIKKIVNFAGEILWDTEKPDGAAVKTLDASPLLGLGWKPRETFETGLSKTFEAFLKSQENIRVS